MTLFAPGFLVKRCHYVLHTGPFKDLCMCGMRPPGISMQMNTMCTALSLFPSISPLSCCVAQTWCPPSWFFKETQTSQTVAVPQPASARPGAAGIWSGCCRVVAARPHGSFQNRMLKGKVKLIHKKKRFHQRVMEVSSEENVCSEISVRCSLCCWFIFFAHP